MTSPLTIAFEEHKSHAHVHFYNDKHFDETMAAIEKVLPKGWRPEVGIVCGSGLGGLADSISGPLPAQSSPISINYSDIPNFSKTTVQGHIGKLVFGCIGDKRVVCMVGRFHFYEGHALYETTYPIRIMSLLGCKKLIVTNAAGALNQSLANGDLMLIKDHINFPGMAGHNPLIGCNLSRFGPRFPATSDAYCRELSKLALKCHSELKLESKIHSGVYVYVAGPSYETPAEAQMLRNAGADAVGMSTVPEVIVARHCGMQVVGLSLITNRVLMPQDRDYWWENGEIGAAEKATHEEVLAMSKKRAKEVQLLVGTLVKQLQ